MESKNQQISEFMKAANSGEVDRVRSLLEQGVPVDVEDDSGRTALMQTWDMPVLNALLEEGADIHHRDPDGCTALHHACRDRRLDKMRRLLEAGADLFEANASGRGPLALFLDSGWYKIAVDLLEELYPEIDMSRILAEIEDPEVHWKLALKGFGRTESERDRGGRLLKAIEEGNLSRVEAILEEAPLVELTDAYERTPVAAAICSRRCDARILQVLLEAGARTGAISAHAPSPLEWAVRYGRKEMVQMLDPEYPLTEALERSIFCMQLVDDGKIKVSLYPNESKGLVSLERFAPRAQEGGWTCTAEEALKKNNRAFLKKAKVSWLVPYLERIAGGESIPVSKIEEEFKRRHGKTLPVRRYEES